jgi:MOSC domain-containing protein YiiM
MDLIAPGLCEAMKDGELGMFARVLHGGTIRVGQPVTIK